MQAVRTQKKSDAEIHGLVLRELTWDPRVHGSDVNAQIRNGFVTLTGKTQSYGMKQAASEAAHRVSGVLGVSNDLEVVLPDGKRVTDEEVAQAVRDALQWNDFVSDANIRTTVSNGWVTLRGDVEFSHQKDAVVRALNDIAGVQGVSNQISLRTPEVDPDRIRSSIEAALARHARQEANRIEVRVANGVAYLSGTVRSWSERKAVRQAARYSAGVTRVQDQLVVDGVA